jgi:hypothetical protein
MKDFSKILWRGPNRKPISIAWAFNPAGKLVSVTILPHDYREASKLIMFEDGRAYAAVVTAPNGDVSVSRFQ